MGVSRIQVTTSNTPLAHDPADVGFDLTCWGRAKAVKREDQVGRRPEQYRL